MGDTIVLAVAVVWVIILSSCHIDSCYDDLQAKIVSQSKPCLPSADFCQDISS